MHSCTHTLPATPSPFLRTQKADPEDSLSLDSIAFSYRGSALAGWMTPSKISSPSLTESSSVPGGAKLCAGACLGILRSHEQVKPPKFPKHPPSNQSGQSIAVAAIGVAVRIQGGKTWEGLDVVPTCTLPPFPIAADIMGSSVLEPWVTCCGAAEEKGAVAVHRGLQPEKKQYFGLYVSGEDALTLTGVPRR